MDRLTSCRTFLAGRRAGLLVPVLAVLIGGCSAAGATSNPAVPATPATSRVAASALDAPATSFVGPAVAPAAGDTAPGAGTSGSGAASAAIAYPYPVLGGSAGLAPDHELVVSGTGWANVKADLSNRTTAQRSALAAALADARAQAQAAASDADVTLGGVVSLSVSVGGSYVMPMGVVEPQVTAPSGGSGTSVPPASAGSAPAASTGEQLEVTVTVGYSIS
jgi:hypothetical protein